uniref:AP-3 complex subunit beta n=1 Tax=Macrostomum lignano TaxID=282301 RepID=A0A1I8GBC5_9PLAT
MSNGGFQPYNSPMDQLGLPPPDHASSTGSQDGDRGTRSSAADPAGSAFFSGDFKKHDDLRAMLESSKDSQKLEAMRRIIAMVAKGKDCSDLFPSVVKNVVSKNSEVKKLVYVYLTRYAEEQQDLALLSIATFQRALKDPNQLIRASALRVLTSIRVPVILPIQTLALQDAVSDMSAYVRKTAALAIPKIYSLDPETKPQLMGVIEKLLADKTTLVVGVAIQAFEEICPNRIDLIHKNYRKLCELLADVQDWGQVVIINMLTRYVRTQFLDPAQQNQKQERQNPLDPDHELLLRTVRPLFQSQNAAVVMAVAQLYYHCAPPGYMNIVIRHLVRLLRASPEVQSCVLTSLSALSASSPHLLSGHLKCFYIHSTDSSSVKLVKLDILTNLATDSNFPVLLRELQAYVSSPDSELASAAVRAIGRCASQLPDTTDTCLNNLVSLLAKKDESVVAEAIVVIKKLLQVQTSDHSHMIVDLARLVDGIAIPRARASILWLIGEYCDRIPKIAPDVLRKFAKSFLEEEDQVKLQIVNLAAKLCVCNPKQARLLAQYVLNLAKYDQNYDIRDRSRFLRPLVLPDPSVAEPTLLAGKRVKKILLAPKPAPEVQSRFAEKSPFQLGSLSHLLNLRLPGYQALPDWPAEQPDSSVRAVAAPAPAPSSMAAYSRGGPKEQKSKQKQQQPAEASLLDFGPTNPTAAPAAPSKSTSRPVDPFGLMPDDLLLLPTPSRMYSLVNKYSASGLQVDYSFPRTCLASGRIALSLVFTNHSSAAMRHVTLQHAAGPALQPPEPIDTLEPGVNTTRQAEVAWGDSTTACQLLLRWDNGAQEIRASVQPPVGELLAPVTMSAQQFTAESGKLKGLNEEKGRLPEAASQLSDSDLAEAVRSSANLVAVSGAPTGQLWFAGRSCASRPIPVYVALDRQANLLRVHCEQMTLGSVLHRDLCSGIAAAASKK